MGHAARRSLYCFGFGAIGATGAAMLLSLSLAAKNSSLLDVGASIDLPSPATAIAWSPNGERLAVIHDLGRKISLWTASGKHIRTIDRAVGRGPYIGRSLEFMPDGASVLAPAPNLNANTHYASLALWDVETGNLKSLIPGPAGNGNPTLNSAALFVLSPDRAFVAMSPIDSWGAITIYSTADWSIVSSYSIKMRDIGTKRSDDKTPPDSSLSIRALTFGPDNALFVGTFKGLVKLSSDNPQKPDWRHISSFEYAVNENSASIDSLKHSNIGNLIAIGSAGSTLQNQSSTKHDLNRMGREFIINSNTKANFKILNAITGEYIYSDELSDPIRHIEWSSDSGHIFSVSAKNGIRVYLYRDGHVKALGKISNQFAYSASISPNGRNLAVIYGSGSAGDRITIYYINDLD